MHLFCAFREHSAAIPERQRVSRLSERKCTFSCIFASIGPGLGFAYVTFAKICDFIANFCKILVNLAKIARQRPKLAILSTILASKSSILTVVLQFSPKCDFCTKSAKIGLFNHRPVITFWPFLV